MPELVTLAQWLVVAFCALLLLIVALGGVLMQFENDRRTEDVDETSEITEPTVEPHRRN